jgi:hypothetical protein
MKYPYNIIAQFNPNDYSRKSVLLILQPPGESSRISNILYVINNSYIPYYIQEVEKLINGQRTIPLEIHITDDSDYDVPDEYILVEKDWTYSPEEPEKKLETTELLTFLGIMKKELEVGDEVVVP